ncbi:hypothetical protein [Paenibacillus massiliensis]|uniref:hypothetical protein n=1 Tax=Paenibacillus massiliensis TaxID=225917 RepID=UPI00036BE564|nr:hypothetical protein [Paenibacillus massiliensis]
MKLCMMIIFVCILTSCGLSNNGLPTSENETSTNLSRDFKDVETRKESVDQSENKQYFQKAIYTHGNVKSLYPVLVHLEDSEKQNRINKMLKNDVLRALESYIEDNPDMEIQLDFTPRRIGKELLSIQYLGTSYTTTGAYPVNISFTTNVDLITEKRIGITDLLIINDTFLELLRKAKYVTYDPDLEVESEAKDYFNSYTNHELISYLEHSDEFSEQNELGIYTYITNDSLGISFEVPHAIGDHAEFEISLSELQDGTFK